MSELDTAPRSFGTPEHHVPAPAIPAARTAPAVDPDLEDDLEGGTNSLESLFAELSEAADETERVTVPGRPGLELEVSLSFDNRVIENARKKAKDPGFTDGVDGVRFGAILIAKVTTALYLRGQRMELGGEPLTFQSRALWDGLKTPATGAVDAVRKVLRRDASVDSVARKIMGLAGWGEDADVADPTD